MFGQYMYSCAARHCLHRYHIVVLCVYRFISARAHFLTRSPIPSSIAKSSLGSCAILEFPFLPAALITLDRRRMYSFPRNCLQETSMYIVVIVCHCHMLSVISCNKYDSRQSSESGQHVVILFYLNHAEELKRSEK